MFKIHQTDKKVKWKSVRKSKPQYIVLHDTGNTAPSAGAWAHVNYFHTTSRKASADYVIDASNIVQINDITRYFTWHCGDGKGRYGIANHNSIGIEMCVNAGNNMQATYNRTIYVVSNLMDTYNIPLSRVVRHYDASRKSCPNHMRADNWKKWVHFKQQLQEYRIHLTNPAPDQPAPPKEIIKKYSKTKLKAKVNEHILSLDGFLVDGVSYIPTRQVLELLGYKVDWIDNTIIIDS